MNEQKLAKAAFSAERRRALFQAGQMTRYEAFVDLMATEPEDSPRRRRVLELLDIARKRKESTDGKTV